MSEQACKDCRFFVEYGVGQGFCRRHPPVVATQEGMGGINSYSTFPNVNENDWCGEFEPKQQEQENEDIQISAYQAGFKLGCETRGERRPLGLKIPDEFRLFKKAFHSGYEDGRYKDFSKIYKGINDE